MGKLTAEDRAKSRTPEAKRQNAVSRKLGAAVRRIEKAKEEAKKVKHEHEREAAKWEAKHKGAAKAIGL
jgi:hypothetical protein